MVKHTLAAVNVCREQLHRLVDERLDGLLCDLILGEEAAMSFMACRSCCLGIRTAALNSSQTASICTAASGIILSRSGSSK